MTGRERLTTRALWIAAWTLFVALRIPYLDVPFERDEGGYGYIAQRMLLGEAPYRDAFDQKPPLVFVPYALAFATLGQQPRDVHLVLMLWSAATLLVVAAVARRLGGPLAAAAGGLVFAVLSASPRLLGFTANTEMFMLLPMTAAAWCALRAAPSERAWGAWMASGALAGAACWFKPVAATSAIAIAVYAVATALRAGGARPARRALLRLACLTAGALAATAPVVTFIALHPGALAPFIDGVALYNLAYVQEVPLGEGLAHLVRALGLQLPAFLPVWTLALAAVLLPRTRPAGALVATWLVALAAGTCAGLHFRDHYFVQLVPALAVGAGLALAGLLARFESQPLLGAVVAVAFVAGPTVWADRQLLWAESPQAISRMLYDVDPFPESAQIARVIAAGSAPDESVLILGSEPQILLQAGRRSATRFVFAHSLMLGLEGSSDRRRIAVEEIRASRPRFVVLVRQPRSWLETPELPRQIWSDAAWGATGEHRLHSLFVWDGLQHAYYEFMGSSAQSLLASQPEVVAATAWLALYRRPD